MQMCWVYMHVVNQCGVHAWSTVGQTGMHGTGPSRARADGGPAMNTKASHIGHVGRSELS